MCVLWCRPRLSQSFVDFAWILDLTWQEKSMNYQKLDFGKHGYMCSATNQLQHQSRKMITDKFSNSPFEQNNVKTMVSCSCLLLELRKLRNNLPMICEDRSSQPPLLPGRVTAMSCSFRSALSSHLLKKGQCPPQQATLEWCCSKRK